MHFEYVGYEKFFSGLSKDIEGINIIHIFILKLIKYLPLICVIVVKTLVNFLKFIYDIT